MDVLSRPPLTSVNTGSWPRVQAVEGKYYYVTDQYGDKMAVMTLTTFTMIGTKIKQLEKIAADQNAALEEQKKFIQRLQDHASELGEKLAALRDIRRAEKRADIEPGLVLPGSSNFSTHRKGSR